MSENFSLGGLRKKLDLSKLKGGLKAEQFDFGKKDKLKSVFDQIDTVKDGVITQEELDAYLDKLHTAAGADNRLNRKEAKAAGLGSRRDINKFLKQAIELSKDIKSEFTPEAEVPVTEPDAPTPDVTQPEIVHTEPLAQDPPTVPDTVGDTDSDTVGNDDENTTEELTPQDALKNLFGDKRKASVKIDGSATGLSSKPYTGQVILPNGETIEDGAFPENLRITLPPSYGENATMKLKLIDPENGIYESSAKDRNFQIVTDENGNVTIQSVNIEELQGKLDANLAEYARLEAERKAALERGDGADETENPGDTPPLSKEELLAISKKQQEARALASELYDACDDQAFAVGRDRFQTALHKVNKDNISMVLSQYKDLHPDESLIATICEEMGSGRKEALNYLMTQLAAAARERGIPEADITKATTEFNVSKDAEFRKVGIINPAKMENSMNFLHGLILGADLKAGDINAAQAIDTITGAAAETYDTAKTTFDQAREEEGWIARTGDSVLGWFGCTTKEDMDLKLGEYKADVERLQNAQTEAEFKTAYEDVFGVPFDSKKVAAYEAAVSDYSMANGYKNQMDKLRNLWADNTKYDNYESYRDAVSTSLKTDNFELTPDEIDTIVNEYTKTHPNVDKKAALTSIVSDMMVEQEEMFNQVAKGRTIEQMSAEVDTVRQGAFGTRDIVNDVIKYNANQQMTEMVFEAAGEIALTAALQVIPGAGQIAAAKLAVSAARWGSRGLKVARYAAKTEKALSRVNTAINTGKNANIVRAKKTMSNAAAAFTGTTAVDLSNGKSVKEALQKGLMNATFAGAGAMSSELAPVLAKTYGISNKVAKEIAEEITERAMDVGSSAGISAAFNGGYSQDEAFLDLATGLIMNRLGKFGMKNNGDAPESGVRQSKLDVATSNNASVPGGKFSEQNFEQVKREVKDELAQGATPERAAQIHNEADKLQVQSRRQGREIKHIVEDATGVYDSPTLGKIDLTKETDLNKLEQAKKEISQWFDGQKDVRGDAARDRQALLEKIDARMAELNADPNLLGQKVESKIVDEMNANTEKDAAAILANEGKPLSPHGAAILDDKIKIMDNVEQLETMKKQLESRVGYQVQGTDHAAATIKKIDTKINSVKAHQADFAATTAKIDDAINAGKGLNSDDLQTIRAFMEKCNSADELKQIADKMYSSKAIRSFGGSKKLIADINTKIETLNTKNAALAATDAPVETPTGGAASVETANYIDDNNLLDPKVDTPEVKAKETPAADAPKVETEEVTPKSIADDMKSVDDVDIPPKYKELWDSCKTKLKYLTNEVTQSLGNLSKSTLAKCEALIGDLKTISSSVTGKVKAQIDKLIKNFEKLIEKTKVNDNVEIVSVGSPSNKPKVNDNVEIVSVGSPSNKAKVNDNVEIVSVGSPSNKAKVNVNVENTNPVSNKKIKLDYPEISTKNGTQVLTKGQKYVLDLNKNQDTQFALGFGVANLDVNDKLFLEKFNALKEGESFTVGSWEGNADYKIGSMQLGVSREHFTVQKENGQMVIIDKKSTNGTKMRKNTSEYVSSNEIRQMFKNDRMDYNYLSSYLDKHGFGWKCSYKLDNVDYANMEKLMNVCDGKYVDVWKATTMTDGVPNMQKLATLAKILRKNDAVDDFMKLGPNEWDLIVCTACQKQSNAVEPLMFYKENSNPMNKMLSAGQTSPEIEKLTEFLDKQRINKKVRLYRGEGYNGSLSRAYGSDGQNLGSKMEQLIASGASESKIKQFIDEELLGQEIKQERFMSTTLTPDIAQSWAHGMMGNNSTYGAIRWDISAPAGTKAAFCEDFNIPYGKENEVLVQRNSSLKITNARFDKDTQTWVISARIMQD